jgi:hypothetical protein
MRKWFLGLSLVVLLVVVGAAAAEDDNAPLIDDGRVNAWDIAANVIVYCEYDDPDAESGTRETIDLWAQRYSDGAYEKVLSVEIDELRDAMEENTEDVVYATSEGYSLVLFADDTLMATAPADYEGKVYSFSWELGDTNC